MTRMTYSPVDVLLQTLACVAEATDHPLSVEGDDVRDTNLANRCLRTYDDPSHALAAQVLAVAAVLRDPLPWLTEAYAWTHRASPPAEQAELVKEALSVGWPVRLIDGWTLSPWSQSTVAWPADEDGRPLPILAPDPWTALVQVAQGKRDQLSRREEQLAAHCTPASASAHVAARAEDRLRDLG